MFHRPHDTPTPPVAAADASLAEILSAFSYALDLTEGQPAGHSIRASWIGSYIAMAMGLSGTHLRDCSFAVLLKDLGCSSNAARVAELFIGDDRKLKHQFKLIGPNAADFMHFVEHSVGELAQAEIRSAAVDHFTANAGAILTGFIDTRCTKGADIARTLRFSEDVASGIASLDEHWDGSGLPHGLAGDAIPLISRIALIAQVTDVFFMTGGPQVAIDEVVARSGSWFDPAMVAIIQSLAEDANFWRELGSADIEDRLFALEPSDQRVHVDEDYLDDIASAFGHVIDAKSPYTGGHSDRVGLFADKIAAQLGMAEPDRRRLRRAAMLHDVGKLGVSSSILEKPGTLDADEWVIMKSHAAETTNILSRVSAMADMAMIAGSHHERLDGGGFPLGLDTKMIALETRIITVADFFDALTADRPYRAALSVERALAIMADEVGSAIDADCYAAMCTVVASGIPSSPLPSISI